MNCNCGVNLKHLDDGYPSKLIKGKRICRRCSIEEFNKYPNLFGVRYRIYTPIKLTEDFRIVDAYGDCLIPDITFKTDLDHINRQKWLGEGIVRAMNTHPELWEVSYGNNRENFVKTTNESARLIRKG